MPIEVEIEIRECTTLDELAACVQLQRDVSPCQTSRFTGQTPGRYKDRGRICIGSFFSEGTGWFRAERSGVFAWAKGLLLAHDGRQG